MIPCSTLSTARSLPSFGLCTICKVLPLDSRIESRILRGKETRHPATTAADSHAIADWLLRSSWLTEWLNGWQETDWMKMVGRGEKSNSRTCFFPAQGSKLEWWLFFLLPCCCLCLGAFRAAMFDVGRENHHPLTPSIFDEVVLLCCGCFSTWTAFCVLSALSHFCCVVFFIDGDDDVSRGISISVPSCACVAIDGDFVFFFCFDLVMQGKNKRGKRART